MGGAEGIRAGEGIAADQVAKYFPSVEVAYPGLGRQLNGRFERAVWPDNPFVKASYSSYLVGQWTTLANVARVPIGNLFFAGEHCSYDFQGCMNGGLETGRVATANVYNHVRG